MTVTHVLITRPEPEASESAKRVAALGLTPIVAPIFEVAILPCSLTTPAAVAATILTSRNAIPACPRILHGKPAYAVGAATAEKASAAGFRLVTSADGNADMLASLITMRLDPAAGTLFLPTAPRQNARLAECLRRRRFHVLRRLAYDVIRMPSLPLNGLQSLASGRVTTALFFSADSAAHFVKLALAAGWADTLRNADAVSISERAVMALKRLPWRCIRVAAQPNQDSMLALLQ